MNPCTCKTECGCLDKVPEPPKCDNSAVPKVRPQLKIILEPYSNGDLKTLFTYCSFGKYFI